MDSMQAVEEIVKHKFKNKSLLKEALTRFTSLESPSNQRLEFLGDSVLGLAITKHIYLAYPNLSPDEMSRLRTANITNEKFARVAIKHGLYQFLQHESHSTDQKVKEFSEAVSKEDDTVTYRGLVKAPKILADLVESIAGAVYIDVNFDLQRFWMIFRGLLEPIVTLRDMKRKPEPITRLYRWFRKQGKQIDFRFSDEGTRWIAKVYVNDEFVASGHAANKDIAKLLAAKEALRKLSKCVEIVIDDDDDDDDEDSPEVETEDAKEKLEEKKLQLQTGSSSLPIASLSYETTPETIVIDLDSEPEDAKGELFVFSATKKSEIQYPLETKKSLEEKKKLINSEKNKLLEQQSLERRKLLMEKLTKKEKILENAGLLRRSKRIKLVN